MTLCNLPLKFMFLAVKQVLFNSSLSFTEHGSFGEDELATKSVSLNSRMVTVKIFCSNHPNLPQFEKKVPKNMTVQKLMGLVQRLMDTGGHIPKLHVISTKVCTHVATVPAERDLALTSLVILHNTISYLVLFLVMFC